MYGPNQDECGQVMPIEYILIFSISTLFFGIMIVSFTSIIDQSSSEAIYIEFTDIGNDISSTITQTYLSIPVNGKVSRTISVPTEVAGTGYIIEISDDNPHEQEKKALKLSSIYDDITVYVPLNNVDLVADINGSASSASGRIMIMGDVSGIILSQG